MSHVKASYKSPKEICFGALRPSPNPATLQERNFLAKQHHLSADDCTKVYWGLVSLLVWGVKSEGFFVVFGRPGTELG